MYNSYRKRLSNLIRLFIILLIMELSNELKLNSKNLVKSFKIRNLQTQTTTLFTTPFTNPITNSNSTNDNVTNNSQLTNKSSKGLTAGGIVAIVIPCVAALIAVGAIAALCRTPSPPLSQLGPKAYINTSLDQLRYPDPIPPKQNIEVVHQDQVVQQPVAIVGKVPVVPVK